MTSAARRKALGFLALTVAAVAGAAVWRPHAHLADSRPPIELEALFPKAFGEWTLDESMPVQLVSPDAAAVLTKLYRQTLSRTYLGSRGRIMLSVAYGGDQSDATRAHRPEVCYPAQGFEVRSGRDAAVPLPGGALPVRELVARQGGRNEPITYWLTVGERVTTTGTQQKLAQLAYSLRGVVPDGMLVRVSSIGNDEAQAFALQQRFVQQLAAALPAAQRAQVLGSAPGPHVP